MSVELRGSRGRWPIYSDPFSWWWELLLRQGDASQRQVWINDNTRTELSPHCHRLRSRSTIRTTTSRQDLPWNASCIQQVVEQRLVLVVANVSCSYCGTLRRPSPYMRLFSQPSLPSLPCLWMQIRHMSRVGSQESDSERSRV